MRPIRTALLLFSALALTVSLLHTAPATAETDTDRQDLLYTCACGKSCDCGTVSTKPGKCSCGKEMRESHVLKVEGNEAIVCTCGGGCKCALENNDSTQCGCGKTVERINLKGAGVYFCNCGGSCKCNTLSDAPGDCNCGMKLEMVN